MLFQGEMAYDKSFGKNTFILYHMTELFFKMEYFKVFKIK